MVTDVLMMNKILGDRTALPKNPVARMRVGALGAN